MLWDVFEVRGSWLQEWHCTAQTVTKFPVCGLPCYKFSLDVRFFWGGVDQVVCTNLPVDLTVKLSFILL